MLTVTVNDLITQARKANGSLGDGIVMSAEEVHDDMLGINIMLAEWSASGYGIFYDTQETFTLTADKDSYDWGASATVGNFVSSRPNEIADQTFLRINGIDYPVNLIGQAEYAAISDKPTTSSWPNEICFEPSYPLAKVYLYPIPDQAYTIYITSSKVLDSFTTLTATVMLPSQYASAIKWNYACDSAPNYNVPITNYMLKRAKESLNIVKSLNANQQLEQVRVQVGDLKPSVYLRNINDAT